MATKDNRKRKFSTASPINPLCLSPTTIKICYNAEYFEEVDKVIHGRFLNSKRLVVTDGGRFTLVRYNSKNEANRYYENAYKAQGEHVPVPSGIHMPKKGHLKDGLFLFYKGHHLKPLSRWLKENKVKNMEENRMLQVIRGIFQGLRTLYQKYKRGHDDLGSEIIEGVAIKEDGHVVLWNLSNKLDAVGKKNIFSQEVISYCCSPLKQIPRAYSQAAGQFTDHQILGFIESAFPRLWCVLHEGLMRAMCVTESGGIISPATFTAIACPWSVRDILTHCIFDPN